MIYVPTYACVISLEPVCIAIMLTSLNSLGMMAEEILNVYITVQCMEKIWENLAFKFGKVSINKAIIFTALYNLKSVCRAFQEHLADCTQSLGYISPA